MVREKWGIDNFDSMERNSMIIFTLVQKKKKKSLLSIIFWYGMNKGFSVKISQNWKATSIFDMYSKAWVPSLYRKIVCICMRVLLVKEYVGWIVDANLYMLKNRGIIVIYAGRFPL